MTLSFFYPSSLTNHSSPINKRHPSPYFEKVRGESMLCKRLFGDVLNLITTRFVNRENKDIKVEKEEKKPILLPM